MGIKSNQDIIDFDQVLEEKSKEYTGTDKHLGLTLMTFPQYISSTRSTMFTNHLKQFNNLNEPEFPKVFTNYENLFGQNSSSLVKADSDYEVIDKIDKFSDRPGYLYAMFLYDKKNDKYDVIFKKISEDLTEKFGYLYNNTKMDGLKPGDTIKKDETIYKSSSYDEDDNYRYGKNAKCVYILEAGNIEDAYVVSESLANSMVSRKVDCVKVSINDNDFLLNLYGDADEYKGFPDIGVDVIKRVICAKRRIINDQILYDMKKANMRRISPLNDKIYYSKGFVTDIEIYANKEVEDIPDTDYNKQLIYYMKNQNRYYKQVLERCEEIINSGSKYSDDIGFIYTRASHILDPNWKWRDNNNSEFNNVIIELRVDRDVKLFAGSKITGRFGDKGVLSRVRADDEMPFDEDGNRVDLICNPLSCPNRLNPFQWIELSLNHCANQLIVMLKNMKSNTERYNALYKFQSYFNERGMLDELDVYYKGLNNVEKDDFWESIYTDGIFINYPPMWENMAAIDKIEQLYKEFGFKRVQLYLNKWGRKIPLMRKLIVGEKYMLKLKQTSEKNFSARSTGYLSQRGLPEKSNKVRTNEQLYSTTPITIGRDEDNNLGIGVRPFMLAKYHLFYRTSPFARKQVGKMYTKDVLDFKKFKIKKGYKNRNVEILNAKLKSIGAKIDFGFNGLKIRPHDNKLHAYQYHGKVYIRTYDEMREFLLDDLLRRNFNKKKRTGSKKELEAKYKRYREKEIAKAQGKLVVTLGDEDD